MKIDLASIDLNQLIADYAVPWSIIVSLYNDIT